MDNQKAGIRFQELSKIFPQRIRKALEGLDPKTQQLIQEIRLRVGQPLQLCAGNHSFFLTEYGDLSGAEAPNLLTISPDEMFQTFRAVCGYSVHSHQEEIAHGFITIQGGHRVGLCGTAVFEEKALVGMRDISSLNVRVAKQVFGCAREIFTYTQNGCKGILLAGPPGSGKTTILRDLTRLLAGREAFPPKNISIVDERGELAAIWQGIPQNDVGLTSDILNGYSKQEGILMAIRTLSPDYIICDEIGTQNDIEALQMAAISGVKMAASFHASSAKEVLARPFIAQLAALGAFSTVILLKGNGQVGQIQQILHLGEIFDENNRFCHDSALLLADGYSAFHGTIAQGN